MSHVETQAPPSKPLYPVETPPRRTPNSWEGHAFWRCLLAERGLLPFRNQQLPSCAWLKRPRDIQDKTISAQEKLTKLQFASSCEDVQKEFKRSYVDQVDLTRPFLTLELIYNRFNLVLLPLQSSIQAKSSHGGLPRRSSLPEVPFEYLARPQLWRYLWWKLEVLESNTITPRGWPRW